MKPLDFREIETVVIIPSSRTPGMELNAYSQMTSRQLRRLAARQELRQAKREAKHGQRK